MRGRVFQGGCHLSKSSAQVFTLSVWNSLPKVVSASLLRSSNKRSFHYRPAVRRLSTLRVQLATSISSACSIPAVYFFSTASVSTWRLWCVASRRPRIQADLCEESRCELRRRGREFKDRRPIKREIFCTWFIHLRNHGVETTFPRTPRRNRGEQV